MKNCFYFLMIFFSTICHSETTDNLSVALADFFENELPNYEVAHYDLNTDGFDDAIVYLNDRAWCGSGGCTMLIFKNSQSGFSFMSKIMITKKPIIIASTQTLGWFDIIVNTGGVGSVILKSNGKKYPLNPSMQPVVNNNLKLKGRYLFK